MEDNSLKYILMQTGKLLIYNKN